MDFIVMALGNIIGSGIFLASSLVISVAGVWTPAAYLLGGLIMMMEVAFIIEMSVANPVAGSFRVYAREIFGDWWGYVIGWMFWTSGVLGMASEVTACAIFMQLWLHHVPLWIFSLTFSILITMINLNDLKGLSKIETGLSFIKVATLVVFIVIGFAVAFGVKVGNATESLAQFYSAASGGGKGITGLLASMLLILFAYTGTGIIGMAVNETEKPERVIPGAAKIITISVVLLYTLAAFFIVAIMPPGALDTKTSPFVTLFTIFRIPFAPDIVNFILLTASLSALNSQVYSASRMLFSLAEDHEAPRLTARKNKKGVPVAAVWLSGIVLMGVVLLSYLLPKTIFIYTVSASGFLAMVNWMSVSVTHVFYRRKIEKTAPEKLKYKAPWYPYLSWFCFALILVIFLSSPLYPDQLPGLYSGGGILLVIALSYLLIKKKK
ncbi:amino acid permease [Lucifera butyrica]|nr:amino acid permease [Lucifera butyrica]